MSIGKHSDRTTRYIVTLLFEAPWGDMTVFINIRVASATRSDVFFLLKALEKAPLIPPFWRSSEMSWPFIIKLTGICMCWSNWFACFKTQRYWRKVTVAPWGRNTDYSHYCAALMLSYIHGQMQKWITFIQEICCRICSSIHIIYR